MVLNYIIGPSHIHSSITFQIDEEITNKELFNNCILDGYCGIPIWSNHIYNCINNNVNINNNVFWLISDYKFNNKDYTQILDLQNKDELFLETIGHSNNVSIEYLDYEHIELLGNHSIKVIDYIINKFPNIKLIFWCLYKRTKVNKNSSYPKHLWYDVIKEKYKNNILDIDLYTNPEEFSLKILDNGAHPNKEGFILLDTIINGNIKNLYN
jgi:hypothetical protein